jgi:hypothetical protein
MTWIDRDRKSSRTLRSKAPHLVSLSLMLLSVFRWGQAAKFGLDIDRFRWKIPESKEH